MLYVALSIETILLLAKQTINLFYQFHQLLGVLLYGGLGTQGLPQLQLVTFQFRLQWGMGRQNDKQGHAKKM